MEPQIGRLLDLKNGIISQDVFNGQLYQRELQRVFGRTWLLVGHDSLVPNNHDFVTSFMGEDPIILQRDGKGAIRVYLNKCRHRGNAVCVHDRGNAASFTCSYHGWSYNDGALTAVPLAKEAYFSELDMKKMSLVEVPKVRNYGGLIFACWDPDVVSLDTYLGDAAWWLDNFLLREELGGLEVLKGPQRYMMPINWKLLAENFAGDDYHFISTHASVLRALSKSQDQRVAVAPGVQDKRLPSYDFSIAANHGYGVPHGFLEVKAGPLSLSQDMAIAEKIGPEAIEWVNERERLLSEKLKKLEIRPYSWHAGNIFPNFAMIGVGSAFYGKGLILHHPRGPDKTEVWMWCALEKGAPESVKKHQRFVLMQRQAAAGMVAPDDHENFERISDTMRAPVSRAVPYHYAMAIGHDDHDPRPAEWKGKADWPGKVVPQMTELIQRDFYRYWQELMEGGPQ
jgi:phenylpropionate dioxygenase-like ring-hydroxylating dioxygenase large terminal subunit